MKQNQHEELKIIASALIGAVITLSLAIICFVVLPTHNTAPKRAGFIERKAYTMRDKVRATACGLPWSTEMVAPNKDGEIYVYIDNGDRRFRTETINAIYQWGNASRIPIKPAMNKAYAQIEIKLVKKLPKNGKSITMGVINLKQSQLTYHSVIRISKAGSAMWKAPDYGTVVEHEIGHALGLDHNKKRRDVMNANIEIGDKLSKQDIEQAQRNYKAVIDSRK